MNCIEIITSINQQQQKNIEITISWTILFNIWTWVLSFSISYVLGLFSSSSFWFFFNKWSAFFKTDMQTPLPNLRTCPLPSFPRAYKHKYNYRLSYSWNKLMCKQTLCACAKASFTLASLDCGFELSISWIFFYEMRKLVNNMKIRL